MSGPDFLYDNKKMWSIQTIETLDAFVAINVLKENILTRIQYGSWSKMVRVIRWVLRISFNLKARKLKGETRHGALTVMELMRAEKMLCKEIQKREFIEEYAQLGNKEVVSNKSKLRQLSPYLDKEGLIRVGGRIKNAAIPDTAKRQILY